LKYRAEIDGLRALAVMPVILFHAGFNLFQGGFVGVDIFFVISGYLITTILVEDIENKRLSLVYFYERRARRILPALFIVMFTSLPVAWLWMLPEQMKDFSQSLIAVSFFASNFLFWRESGYFDAAAEEKPLLHTWSLAVEEQYYLLFPVFLLLLWRYGKHKTFWTIAFCATVSLLLSEWGWRHQATANFYLAPTRAWELLAGSISAFILRTYGIRKNNLLSILGLAAILFALLAYDHSTPFPSLYTLVPVLGVVLLILYASPETWAAKLLGMRACVGVGLISYSAYLWHQPLFAFARIQLDQPPPQSLMAFLTIFSLMAAAITWKYVEQPFRDRKKITRRSVFLFSITGLLFFVGLGLLGHFEKIKTYPALQAEDALKAIELGSYGGEGASWIDLAEHPKIVLTGDSHAKQYIQAIRERIPGVTLYAEPACLSLPTLINQYQGENVKRKNCIDLHKKYLSYIEANKSVHTLLIAQRWRKDLFDLKTQKTIGRAYASKDAFQRLQKELRDFLTSMNEQKLRVIFIGNVPSARVAAEQMQHGFTTCVYRHGKGLCPEKYNRDQREGGWINQLLRELSEEFQYVEFLDTADALCDESNCYVVRDNELLYSDHAHLTLYGARHVAKQLEEKFLAPR